MEFLKAIFGDAALTYDQLAEKLAGSKEVKLANLADGAYVSKEKFAAEAQKVEAANKTIQQLQETVKKFDGVDAEKLKGDFEALQEKYNADTARLALDKALDIALLSSKARDVKAVRALLDGDKIKFDGDKLTGLDDQLEALKKSHDYMFESEKPVLVSRVDSGKGHEIAPGTTPTTLAGALKELYEPKG